MKFISYFAIAAFGLTTYALSACAAADELTPDMQVCLYGSVMTELVKPHRRLHADDDDFATAAVKRIFNSIIETCGPRASEWPAANKFVGNVLENMKRDPPPTEVATPTSNDSVETEEARKKAVRDAAGYRDPPGTRVLR